MLAHNYFYGTAKEQLRPCSYPQAQEEKRPRPVRRCDLKTRLAEVVDAEIGCNRANLCQA